MDFTIRSHIDEIAALEGIELAGIFVAPGVPGRHDEITSVPWPNFRGFVSDLQSDTSRFKRAARKVRHVLTGGVLAQYGSLSASARKSIREALAANYDLVVVDHAQALANVSPWRLAASGAQLIFIAHDVTHRGILDAARLTRSPFVKAYSYVQAFQFWMLETYIVRKSAVAIFLSEWDRRQFQWLRPRRSVALCPVLSTPRPRQGVAASAAPREKNVVFVGSPGHSPNKFALEWIISRLAPELAALDPSITISLVGNGTQTMPGIDEARNIRALGFVSEDRLALLLENCLCMISPVIHGSGIKTKIIDALNAGCPVLATEESLRGFEFMHFQPRIDIANPRACAEQIVALGSNSETQEAERINISRVWAEYRAWRAGRLRRIVTDALELGSRLT